MLRDGYYMSPTEAQEELEEVQTDLRKRDDEYEKETSSTLVQDPETGVIRKTTKTSALMLLSRIFLQAFTLTFLAEWGDRSQLTTIILAAREDVYGVILGGILGHSFCTGLAVLGGRIIAQRISVRTVTIIGGLVFLLFALTALFVNPVEDV
ncbi:putative transmembrane protein 165 [Lasius niger]|uniref:GDT1 family protein n=2 Tax=Lasius TaxID=488720 RepID=A0A0J7L8S0_LASNI|nr:putative transmembrane protein 165 [Lasius niger]